MALFSRYVPFKKALEQYLSHCQTVFDEIGDRTSSSIVKGFVKDFDRQRYNITILGSLKRGKSTLLNTLMERRDDSISPIATNVCTSAIIKYHDKALDSKTEEKAIVYFGNGDSSEIPLRQLRNYVTEEENPENRKDVRSVDVYGDFPEWSKAVTIVDSPGQNSVFNYHDVLLTEFLPYTDAIVFLVAADLPLDGGDIALLKALSKEQQKKIFFVLTKIDALENEGDLADVKDYVTEKIHEVGLPCDHLYSVSAKSVYAALIRGISGEELEVLKGENGIAELERDLEQFIVENSDQTKLLRSRIEMLLSKTKIACDGYLSESNALLSKKVADLELLVAEKKQLADENEELRSKSKNALKTFERHWTSTLRRFKNRFHSQSDILEDKISGELKKGGFVDAVFRSFKMKDMVQRKLAECVQPIANELEEKLGKVIEELDSEIEEDIFLYLRKKGDGTANVSVASLSAGGVVGVAAAGGAASIQAAQTVIGAGAALQAAKAALAMAKAEASWGAVGLCGKMKMVLFGAKEVAAASANVSIASSAFLSASLNLVFSVGGSILATYLAQKLLQIVLTQTQEMQVPKLVSEAMAQMDQSLDESLDRYKTIIVDQYSERLEDLIAGKAQRIDEISNLLERDDPETRRQIEDHISKVQTLLTEGVHVESQVPLLTFS